MRPPVQGVDPPSVLRPGCSYARDSFVDSQAGPFVLSRGGPRHAGPGLTGPKYTSLYYQCSLLLLNSIKNVFFNDVKNTFLLPQNLDTSHFFTDIKHSISTSPQLINQCNCNEPNEHVTYKYIQL